MVLEGKILALTSSPCVSSEDLANLQNEIQAWLAAAEATGLPNGSVGSFSV